MHAKARYYLATAAWLQSATRQRRLQIESQSLNKSKHVLKSSGKQNGKLEQMHKQAISNTVQAAKHPATNPCASQSY
jgi:hypothetical protein